ncbi:MAG: DUF2062 domain-containing protein [Flavobacteriaceae bacterium]
MFSERLRQALWPRRGWGRSVRYVSKRLLRLSASPHAIAAGTAAGVFASFSPFIGTHFIQAAVLAWITRGNVIASALGTFIGNPLTFPFIWAASFELGKWLIGARGASREIDLSQGVFHHSFDALWPILKPMSVGGLILGVVAWAVVYFPLRRLVAATKKRRKTYFSGLAEERKRARDVAQKEAEEEERAAQ